MCRKYLPILCFIVSSLFISRCGRPNGSVYLDGTASCKPPCWNSIIPGETSYEEVLIILGQMEANGQGHMTILGESQIKMLRWEDQNRSFYYINLENDVVSQISFRIISFTLNELINRFGDPEYLHLINTQGGPSGAFYYPSKGLAFYGGAKWGTDQNFQILPETVISAVFFTPPSDLDTMVANVHGSKVADDVLRRIKEWEGYGNYPP